MCSLATIGLPFIPGADDLRPFLADLVLTATVVAVLLTPFFTRRANLATAAVALVGVLLAFGALFVTGAGPEVTGQHFRGLMVIDPFAILWKGTLLLFVAGIIVMWFATTASSMHEGDGPEFFTLLLGATLGMSLMPCTSNLLMLVLCIELASLPSYVLAGFRKTHRVGAEASLKYVLFGAATSAVMVYGVSILYGLYGTLSIPDLASAMAHSSSGAALLAVAIFGLIVGVGFKISAVPFHFWCPDVFEGASIDVSAFLSVASKGAALALLLRVLLLIANSLGYHNVPGVSLNAIAAVIGVIGAITATVGNTAAFPQTNIKRLLAYSSIAHAGYMLCALSLLVRVNMQPAIPAGPGLFSSAPAQAILLYLSVYMFMNLGAFTVAGAIYKATGSEKIEDYAALGSRNPLLAFCMTCFMVSLVGLPPFGGFVAKLNVMYVLWQGGFWWWWLVVVIGVNTIFSLFYYARVLRAMYLIPSSAGPVRANPLASLIAVTCAVALLLLFFCWGPLNTLTTSFAKLYLAGNSSIAKTTSPESPVTLTAP
jgi:NADH-quinone oxidoreductase subunit N